jgi:ferredoxin
MKKKIAVPTYTKDIVGRIRRFDERDTVFAVHDLYRYFGEQSPYFDAYFEAHPAERKFYEVQNKKLSLGATGKKDAPMFAAQFWALNMISTDPFVDGESVPQPIKIDPARASEKIKRMAKFLGADLVGVAALRQEWVYSHAGSTHGDQPGFSARGTPIDLSSHTSAIAIGIHMDYDLMQYGPQFPELLATARGYTATAWVSIQLAAMLRQWGYSARAHHFGNYQVLPVPIAVDCGLGELSRAGYLLTKEYGLGLRLAAVTTDMPLAYDSPIDIGVQSFCEQCELCARYCPSKAIPSGPKQEFNGVLKWKLDEKRCYSYWAVNQSDCGMCMSVCPWTKPPTLFHKSMAEMATVKGPHQRWMAWADNFIYHNAKPKAKPADFLGF